MRIRARRIGARCARALTGESAGSAVLLVDSRNAAVATASRLDARHSEKEVMLLDKLEGESLFVQSRLLVIQLIELCKIL